MTIDETPYKGLRPYTEKDHQYFFGREGDCEIVAANLKASRLTVFYGASGVGKSSLLRAAVLRDINEEARQRVARGRLPDFIGAYCQDWRDNPRQTIEAAFRRSWDQVGLGLSWVEEPAASLNDLLDRLSKVPKAGILLVLDQFEEYLYYHAAKGEESDADRELIEVIASRHLRLNVMISLREDAVTHLDQFKGRISSLYDNYLRLDHLNRVSASDAIVRPVEKFNEIGHQPQISVEHALVEAVLDQVGAGKLSFREKPGAQAASGGDRIETPYLQLVLTRLWEEEMKVGSRVLQRATLARLGESDSIVKSHLDARMAAFSEEEQKVAERVFFHLVTPSKTKVAHSVPDLAAFAGVNANDVERLASKLASPEHRILRAVPPLNPEHELTRYEIYHDALAEAILEWQQRYRAGVQQQEFETEKAERLKAEKERLEHEKERERSQRQKKYVLASLAAGIVGLALAMVAWMSANLAHQQTQYAEEQRRAALAAQRIADQRLQSIRTSLLIRQAALSGQDDKLQFAVKNATQNRATRFFSSATSRGYQDSAGRTIHRFRVGPVLSTLPGGPSAVAFVTYLADHPTFRNTLMTAGPSRNFAVEYDGWGCIPIVALIEYANPEKPPVVSEFDMCQLIGWR